MLDTRRLFQCAAEDLRELDMLVPLASITRCTTRLYPLMSFFTLHNASADKGAIPDLSM